MCCPKPRVPIDRGLCWCQQIGRTRRNGLKSRLECEPQAEQRAVQVKVGEWIARGDDLRRAGKTAHQRLKRPLNVQNNARAAGRHERHIAAELDGVAKTLLTVQQDRLAADRFLAKPERLRKMASGGGHRLLFPPPL